MANLNEQNGSVTLEQAQEVLEGFSSVNLDEVSPEVIRVAFRELHPGPGGQGVVVTTSVKEINTWVPMFLFNRMLANQKKVQQARRIHAQREAAERARERLLEDEEGVMVISEEPLEEEEEEDSFNFTTLTDEAFKSILANSEPALLWQAREVLTVWKLTPGEGEMSLKRLLLGLTFEQIQGLFMHFFGAMLRQKQNKA
jgi:hypothetical protein